MLVGIQGLALVDSKKLGLSVIKDVPDSSVRPLGRDPEQSQSARSPRLVFDRSLGLLITRNVSKTNSLEICGLLEKMEDRDPFP